MKATEFCYWLQGYFELTKLYSSEKDLTIAQTECIKKHLNMVFKHEIDPSYPDSAELSKIHNKPVFSELKDETLLRC